jgi:hypothetical protein
MYRLHCYVFAIGRSKASPVDFRRMALLVRQSSAVDLRLTNCLGSSGLHAGHVDPGVDNAVEMYSLSYRQKRLLLLLYPWPRASRVDAILLH